MLFCSISCPFSFPLPSPPPRFLFLSPFEVELQIYLSMFLCYNMVWPLAEFSNPDFQSKALSETTAAVCCGKQFLSTLMFRGPPGFSLRCFVALVESLLCVCVCLIGSCFVCSVEFVSGQCANSRLKQSANWGLLNLTVLLPLIRKQVRHDADKMWINMQVCAWACATSAVL